MEKIDFVITWVDGSDPKWLAEKKKYENVILGSPKSVDANSICRYRADSELLRYLFRSIEKFAPWVNKIHFVTCGQKPNWLNISHPKLNLVNHKDYIPSEYLPTFNSNVIELNLHRLSNLEECFVLFNDDTFLLRPTSPSLFFKKGVPVLSADLMYPNYLSYNNWGRILYNDYCVVNSCFYIKKAIWNNRWKWFNIMELGLKQVEKNFMCFMINKTLPVGVYDHVTQPHLKSSLQEVWDRCFDIMDLTSSSKFRSDEQVNQYLLCAWNQAKGRFAPIHKNKRGQIFEISPTSIDRIVLAIKDQQFSQICLNDSPVNTQHDTCHRKICDAYNMILPNKSEFEL